MAADTWEVHVPEAEPGQLPPTGLNFPHGATPPHARGKHPAVGWCSRARVSRHARSWQSSGGNLDAGLSAPPRGARQHGGRLVLQRGERSHEAEKWTAGSGQGGDETPGVFSPVSQRAGRAPNRGGNSHQNGAGSAQQPVTRGCEGQGDGHRAHAEAGGKTGRWCAKGLCGQDGNRLRCKQ